jgi:hypothetical protein
MGEGRKVYRVLVGKYKGKRWGVEWIDLAQDRDQWQALVNVVMNLQVLAPQS